MANLQTIVNKNDNDPRRGYMLPDIDIEGNLTGAYINVGENLPFVRYLIEKHGVGQWKFLPNSETFIKSQRLILGLLLFTRLPNYRENWRQGTIKNIASYLFTDTQNLLNDPDLPI
jgi:hypothetical protein